MADRNKQSQIIKDFIERTVKPRVKAFESREKTIDAWTKRFEAVRSIQGLSYGDDPEKFPKTEPWEDSSDVGIPIEAITIRAIVARFVKTILGSKPIANVSGRGKSDYDKAKVVEEYNSYSLECEMNFERNFFDTAMDVCLAGDGVIKLIEADEEYSWEETHFTLIDPQTNEPIPDPNNKNEYDLEWPDGYPIEVAEDFQPPVNPATGLIPRVEEITYEKTDKTYFGTKAVPVDPRNFIYPEDCDTWDIDEMPWCAHRFKKSWSWLKKRESEKEGDGGYENLDELKDEGETDDTQSLITKRIDLIEVWAEVDIENSNGEVKPKEIIALYALEKGVLLGWIQNPYRGKRMFFHYQIMPMSHRFEGKSIPEFAKGIRDLIDCFFNNMANRDTINSHPPFVYDEESGFDPEIHEFGPHEFWGVTDKARLGRLDMGSRSEFTSQWIIEFTLGLIQKLFGVTDYTTGSVSSIAENKTARGIMAIIGEGNFSFDTMIALLQMTNKKLFEANIRMTAKMLKEAGMDKKVFYVTESSENPFREIEATTMSLGWNFIPKGTSVEANVYKKREDAERNLAMLSKNIFFSPQTPSTMNNLKVLTQIYCDAYNIKQAKLPSMEEIQQEMIRMQADVQQELKKRQELEQLKATAKIKRGTPEGNAAQKVLDSIALSGQKPPQGGQGEKPIQSNIQAQV